MYIAICESDDHQSRDHVVELLYFEIRTVACIHLGAGTTLAFCSSIRLRPRHRFKSEPSEPVQAFANGYKIAEVEFTVQRDLVSYHHSPPASASINQHPFSPVADDAMAPGIHVVRRDTDRRVNPFLSTPCHPALQAEVD